jgi:hypothetical protein
VAEFESERLPDVESDVLNDAERLEDSLDETRLDSESELEALSESESEPDSTGSEFESEVETETDWLSD